MDDGEPHHALLTGIYAQAEVHVQQDGSRILLCDGYERLLWRVEGNYAFKHTSEANLYSRKNGWVVVYNKYRSVFHLTFTILSITIYHLFECKDSTLILLSSLFILNFCPEKGLNHYKCQRIGHKCV